jgi:hypothetical protein
MPKTRKRNLTPAESRAYRALARAAAQLRRAQAAAQRKHDRGAGD